MSEAERIRCMAQALLPGGHWKTCIRETDHKERHVWLESFGRSHGRPVIVVWSGTRSTSPLIAEVMLPNGPIADGVEIG